MLLYQRGLPCTCAAFSRQLQTLPTALPASWHVSSHGRLSNPFGIISLGSAESSGYFRARIHGERLYVHRVVANAFLGPPPSEDAWQVHHKDGNPSNNSLTNLEYVTGSQNQRHSYASGTRRCSGPTRSKPVMYRALGTKGWARCPSITAAALELGVSQGAVSQACRRQTPLKGYEVCVADLPQPELPGEDWKPMLCPVSGEEVPGRLVSSLGRLRTCVGAISTGYLRRDGYFRSGYSFGSGSRYEYVYRLVACAFLGPPPSPHRSHVNHRDGDKGNNAAFNLEYVTPAENMAHYWRNRTARPEGKSMSSSKPVWSRAYNSCDGWTWHPSITRAAQALGLKSGLVSHCIHSRQRQTGGFEFQAADVVQSLPGEEWRVVDVPALVEEKQKRKQAPLRAA